ncbi:MAG: hypothetical protein CHKLHMKO_00445 [Candidatus Argoarchaeum ethanivorans]|uniref:Uncharacterized protein n=1 Tax=Candidatus Argoarchaeum ethanivorans TaxID=2608793 RepID=A0A811TCB4_9EURY|nr:MAG: hypothetical protein CHKLHMKO_00445 [Candidatus Argoarchaeum ethanivorans]
MKINTTEQKAWSTKGMMINADVNCALNIGRKAIPKAFSKEDVDEIGGTTAWVVTDDDGADFTNIQAAVDAAIDGDSVEVWDGSYV